MVGKVFPPFILNRVKNFKKRKKHFLVKSLHVTIFCKKLKFYLDFRLQTLVLLFFPFRIFTSCNAFYATFNMGIFYFILDWKSLKTAKLKKMFVFLTISNKFAIKNNPFLQLHSIFYKTINRNKMKVRRLQSHRLSSFSAIKKTVTGVERRGG